MEKKSNKISAFFKKYISPVYLVLLLLTLILWYLTQLSYTYTAMIPIDLNIAGNRIEVEGMAEGSGYRIIYHRMFKRGTMQVSLRDIHLTPSRTEEGYYEVSPGSLQNLINARNNDLRLVSIGEIPPIKINNNI